jgi:hypothetical protein
MDNKTVKKPTSQAITSEVKPFKLDRKPAKLDPASRFLGMPELAGLVLGNLSGPDLLRAGSATPVLRNESKNSALWSDRAEIRNPRAKPIPTVELERLAAPTFAKKRGVGSRLNLPGKERRTLRDEARSELQASILQHKGELQQKLLTMGVSPADIPAEAAQDQQKLEVHLARQVLQAQALLKKHLLQQDWQAVENIFLRLGDRIPLTLTLEQRTEIAVAALAAEELHIVGVLLDQGAQIPKDILQSRLETYRPRNSVDYSLARLVPRYADLPFNPASWTHLVQHAFPHQLPQAVVLPEPLALPKNSDVALPSSKITDGILDGMVSFYSKETKEIEESRDSFLGKLDKYEEIFTSLYYDIAVVIRSLIYASQPMMVKALSTYGLLAEIAEKSLRVMLLNGPAAQVINENQNYKRCLARLADSKESTRRFAELLPRSPLREAVATRLNEAVEASNWSVVSSISQSFRADADGFGRLLSDRNDSGVFPSLEKVLSEGLISHAPIKALKEIFLCFPQVHNLDWNRHRVHDFRPPVRLVISEEAKLALGLSIEACANASQWSDLKFLLQLESCLDSVVVGRFTANEYLEDLAVDLAETLELVKLNDLLELARSLWRPDLTENLPWDAMAAAIFAPANDKLSVLRAVTDKEMSRRVLAGEYARLDPFIKAGAKVSKFTSYLIKARYKNVAKNGPENDKTDLKKALKMKVRRN